jgi:hypothetical protein
MCVSNWFSDFFLIWLGTNIYWTWKPILATQKDKIDNFVSIASGFWNNGLQILDKYIPKYKEPVKRD